MKKQVRAFKKRGKWFKQLYKRRLILDQQDCVTYVVSERKVLPVPTTKEGWAAEYYMPKWLKKRDQILKRDKYTCTKCGCKDHLQVHHLSYSWGKHVWEYLHSNLITVCQPCHEEIHRLTPIKEFYK